MRRLIERLREKPKEVRVQVSFLTALCVTGVIGVLWGVTLPMRLQGFPPSDRAQSANDLDSFFANTRDNLGQLIGATGKTLENDVQNKAVDNAPKSNAYQAGAPLGAPANNDYQLEAQQPVVIPVNRQEVRIGTTTSSSRTQ